MNEDILVIPGAFVPHHDTVTLLTYQRLRSQEGQYDVLALKASADELISEELNHDIAYRRFNIREVLNYDQTITIAKPYLLPLGLINMARYVHLALKTAREKPYRYLYTSSVPGISHICGYRIKKQYPDIKWTASFSDPIKNSPYKKDPDLKKRNIFYRLAFQVGSFVYMNDRYEEMAIRHADKLVFICEEQRDYTLAQYPDIPDAYERSVIEPLTEIPSWQMYQRLTGCPKVHHEPLKAIHLGRLYGLRKIDNFLTALKELKDEDPHLAEKIVFHQYSEIQPYTLQRIKDEHLEDLFIIHDKVPYEESVKIMQDADILVLFDTLMPEAEVQPYLPSKIVEYLLLDKPILATSQSNSPAYRILKEKGYPYVGNEASKIKENILSLIKEGRG